MLETSASESVYAGKFTLSTQLIKPKYVTGRSAGNENLAYITVINASAAVTLLEQRPEKIFRL